MLGTDAAQNYLSNYGIHVDVFRYLLIGGLIFTRIFTMTMFVPYLGVRPIPGRIRLSVTVALVMFFYPILSGTTTGPLPAAGGIIFALFLKETLFGILLGLSSSMVFYGVQAAGGMVDNQRQLANAQIFNPSIGSQASLFGVFYYQLAIVVFLLMGGHLQLFQALGRSFIAVPLLQFPATDYATYGPVLEIMIRLGANTLLIALQLSAPVLVAIFIADIILGLTNRVAPMVNVFELGFSLKGYVGAILVYLSLPLVIFQMKYWFTDLLHNINRMIELFIR